MTFVKINNTGPKRDHRVKVLRDVLSPGRIPGGDRFKRKEDWKTENVDQKKSGSDDKKDEEEPEKLRSS
jgi:hypothetical protein